MTAMRYTQSETYSPALVPVARVGVREDTAVGEDLRERSRGEGDKSGECEHLSSELAGSGLARPVE